MANLLQKVFGVGSTNKAVATSLPNASQSADNFISLASRAKWFGRSAGISFDGRNWINDFHKCPPLSTIIGRKARAFNNAEIQIVNRNTLEPIESGLNDAWALIDNPNPYQDRLNYEAMVYSMCQIWGRCFVLKVNPYGMNGMPSALYPLPEENLKIEWTKKPYFMTNKEESIKSIRYCFGGYEYALDPSEVFMYTTANACYTKDYNLPDSPLCGLEYPISTIIHAFESANDLLVNHGAMGILSNKGQAPGQQMTSKLNNKDVEGLQRDYKNKYGLGRDKHSMIITTLDLDFIPISLPIAELMLSEQIAENTKIIADKLGYPADLLGISENRTYENAAQASSDLYDMTIIPDAKNFYLQHSRLVFGSNEMIILPNYNHVAAVQEDEAEKARAEKDRSYAYEKLWKSDLYTRNQILEMEEKEPVEGGDIYYSQWLKLINETQNEEI